MRKFLTLPNLTAANAKATALHNWLIANDTAYSTSVTRSQTVRWAIPQDMGNGTYTITVKQRCRNQLSGSEITESGL